MNEQWRDIETAPKDGTLVLGWCIHDADPYFTEDGEHLTTYAANSEGLAHVDDGVNIIKWEDDLDEGEYIVPAWWHLADGYRETAANPTHWMPLPEPPQETNMNEDQALDDMLNGVSDGESKPTFEDYAELVRQWASDRQIIQNSTAAAQLEKLDEERQETIEAIYQYMFREELSNDPKKAWDEVVDGFGDMAVCLINAAAIAGVDLTGALAHAYETIKDRRGYLASNGIFIKDEATHE